MNSLRTLRSIVLAVSFAAGAGAAEAADYFSVAGRGTTFIIAGSQGTLRRSTDEALTFGPTTVSPATDLTFRRVAATGQAFIAVGEGGLIYFSNLGGSSWGPAASPTTVTLNGIAQIGSSLVAVGAGGTILQSFSLTGNGVWQEVSVAPGVTAALYDVTTANTHSVAVGAGGTILQGNVLGSSFMTVIAAPTSATLRDVAPFQNALLAVGDAGTILRSTDDGLTWEPQASPTSNDLNALAVSGDGSVAIACGEGGVLLWSTDGLSWNFSGASPLPAPLFGATFDDGYFVVVGANALFSRAQPTGVGQSDGWHTTTPVKPLTWGSLKQSFAPGK